MFGVAPATTMIAPYYGLKELPQAKSEYVSDVKKAVISITGGSDGLRKSEAEAGRKAFRRRPMWRRIRASRRFFMGALFFAHEY
jgi:hypothetical protein